MNMRKFAKPIGAPPRKRRKASQIPDVEVPKKHSLDSDEEDEYDETQDKLDENEFEGEEEGASRQDEGVRMTAFNMDEEKEEGHFDKEGHFIWNNEREIRDSWLDNIEWHKIQDDSKYNLTDDPTLGAESESEEEAFDEPGAYANVLKLMKPKETVNKAIRRLGGGQKLSSVERLKRKKAGTLNENPDLEALTGFANSILTNTGNMDVYQETYEEISAKVDAKTKPKEAELDMYADDFTDKEQQASTSTTETADNGQKWEFKRDQNKDDVEGPYDTQQMIKYASEGHFKTGVWVRKCGEENFYSSNRIDFELYE